MTRKKTITTVATGTLVAALLSLSNVASADLTTRCVGEAGPVTLPTDLVVPRGQSCVLNGTIVQGDVRVAPDADLIIEGGAVEGTVRVTSNAYLETFETDLSGAVTMRGAFGTFLASSDLGDGLDSRVGADEIPGFVFTEDVDVDGDVRVVEGELLLDGSAVTGSVIARDAVIADAYDTFVDGELRVIGAQEGSVVCSSAIQGEARFVGNNFGVQLGGDGPLVPCDGSSYWGGDVRIVDNLGGVSIDDNIVNASLILRRNDPVAQIGDGNLVRGEVDGDFEAMLDAPAMMSFKAESSSKAAAKVVDRSADAERAIDSRRDVALDEAAAAGKAF